MESLKPLNQRWGTDVFLLTLMMGFIFFCLLGTRSLFVPDEGRYAEIAREMVTSGDYLTPTLNQIKYFEKPALFYWLGAAAIKIGGASEFPLRSINAVIALLGCLMTYLAGSKLYGRTAGLLAGIILGTSSLYFVMAHMINLDLPVAVFIACSLYSFLLAALTHNPAHSRLYLFASAVAAALAVLTKGLIGIVFPCMIVSLWILVVGEWRQIIRLPLISAFLIFLLIAAPWHIFVNQANPEFFRFYFIEQHILRYTVINIGHPQPAWFFVPTLIAGFFPWSVFLVQAIYANFPSSWKQRRHYTSEVFFIIWAATIFVFFSFSKSKLIPYILPMFPALAVLTGRYLADNLKTMTRGLLTGYIILTILSAALTTLLWNLHFTVVNPAFATLGLRFTLSILLAGSLLSLVLLRRSPRAALYAVIISTALSIMLGVATAKFLDTRTIKPLAVMLKPMLSPDDEVVSYKQYYQDLPFYLGRKVTIVTWRNELTFGMQHQDTREWMIEDKQFLKRWKNKQHRVYMIMSKSEYQVFRTRHPRAKIILLGETPTNVLVTNLPLAIPLS